MNNNTDGYASINYAPFAILVALMLLLLRVAGGLASYLYPIFIKQSQLSAYHYTLQLTGMASEQSLQEFISEHGAVKRDLHLYQTLRNNKPWYVVIFGEYDTHQAFEKASKALPDSLANLDSWIKKHQLVHQDLQLNNE